METDRHEINVVGVQYDNRQSIIASLDGTEKAIIRPEPTNTFDHNALAVFVKKDGKLLQVGYVPKQLAAHLAAHLGGQDAEGVIKRIIRPPAPGMSYGIVVWADIV